jgi:hypothetical protein
MMKLLSGGLWTSSQLSAKNIRTQQYLEGCGSADILINKSGNSHDPSFMLIVEAKLTDSCAETAHQKKGHYADYLVRKGGGGFKRLVYLVPSTWIYEAIVKNRLATTNDVTTDLITWDSISSMIESPCCKSCDPLVHDFGAFLRLRFGPITFSKEDITIMFDQNFTASFTAIRKAETLVEALQDKLAKYCDIRNKSLQANTDQYNLDYKEKKSYSYGFSLVRGTRYLLWLGIWTEVSSPLSFGLANDWDRFTPGLLKALDAPLLNAPRNFPPEWTLREVPQDIFESTEPPLELIWGMLKPILDGVFEASEASDLR